LDSSPDLSPFLLDLDLDLGSKDSDLDLDLKAMDLDLDSDLKVLQTSPFFKSAVSPKIHTGLPGSTHFTYLIHVNRHSRATG